MVKLKPVLFLLVLLIHLSLNGKTQAVSRLGIEMGLVSSTPQEFTSIYGTSYSAPSLISPVLGVKWLYSKSKYFEFSGDCNTKCTVRGFGEIICHLLLIHTSKISLFINFAFRSTAGLNIKLSGRLNTIVSAGIRPNLLVSGKYFIDRNVQMGSQTYMLEHTYNPLNREWGLNPAERFAFQYTFGISARLKHNDISINYIPGYQIRFQRTDYPYYNRDLRNNEFSISLIHSFPLLKSKSGAQNVEQEETVFLKNSIGIYFGYLEGNIYYERNLFSFRRSKLNVRTGLGFFTLPDSGGDIYDKNIIFNISFPYILGKNNSHLEIDAGLKYLEVIGSNPGSILA